MPPKKKASAAQTESKKSVQKKKQQAIEDQTFGLKNKNKSKKVQSYVQSVQKNVLNSGDRKQRLMDEQRAKAKVEAKARKKAMKEEQDALFGEALLAIQKKQTTNQKDGKVEAKGRDAEDEGNKKTTSRAMKMMYQMDAKEMDDRLREDPNYVPTLEDEIEMERQRKVDELKAAGIKGTPVTEESFKEWQERKRKARAEAAKKMVETELKKKKGGKGLGVLSGRALYEYKKTLFDVGDDEEDVDMTVPEPVEEPVENGVESENGGDDGVEDVAGKVQSELFLEGEDDDLDDIDDDE